MKKFIVSLIAITVASNAMAACYGDQGSSCKSKKVRVIHITANNAEQVYGEPLKVEYNEPKPEYKEPPIQEKTSTEDKWYVGAHLDLNLLSFKTKYLATPEGAIADQTADHDKYSFEPVFGGNVFFGRNFSKSWRGDFELGYITKFTDSDQGISLGLSAPYLLGNVYYTI